MAVKPVFIRASSLNLFGSLLPLRAGRGAVIRLQLAARGGGGEAFGHRGGLVAQERGGPVAALSRQAVADGRDTEGGDDEAGGVAHRNAHAGDTGDDDVGKVRDALGAGGGGVGADGVHGQGRVGAGEAGAVGRQSVFAFRVWKP